MSGSENPVSWIRSVRRAGDLLYVVGTQFSVFKHVEQNVVDLGSKSFAGSRSESRKTRKARKLPGSLASISDSPRAVISI